jgi:carboxymethylenebutenolidase
MAAGCGADQDNTASEYAEDMAEAHENDTAEPSGMVAGTTADLRTEMVEYGMVNGQPVTGYLAEPANSDDPLPGIIVIHEWWGLNDNIKNMTEQLAAEGYTALAVDLYGGEVADTPDGAMALIRQATENSEAARTNLMSAFAYLDNQEGAPRVASIGWCFGGGMSLNAALALPADLDAAVIYYGRLNTDPAALSTLQMPILGFFGAEDQSIPVADVEAFEDQMEELDKSVEIHVYEGAGHAFANPSGTNYVEEAAQDSWARTKAFLDEHLTP